MTNGRAGPWLHIDALNTTWWAVVGQGSCPSGGLVMRERSMGPRWTEPVRVAGACSRRRCHGRNYTGICPDGNFGHYLAKQGHGKGEQATAGLI